MTPIFDVDKFGLEQLPVDKRYLNGFRALVKGLLSQMSRTSLMLRKVIDGNNASNFDPLTSYTIGDDVVYNHQVYKSVTGGSGLIPDENPLDWQLVSKSAIGTIERSLYSSVKINLEYALNRYFRNEILDAGFVGFRQPNSDTNPTPSDIFINNVTPEFASFISYDNFDNSDKVFEDISTGVIFDTEIIQAANTYNFAVNIPQDVYDLISSDPEVADSIIRRFVDKLTPVGIYYKIIIY